MFSAVRGRVVARAPARRGRAPALAPAAARAPAPRRALCRAPGLARPRKIPRSPTRFNDQPFDNFNMLK